MKINIRNLIGYSFIFVSFLLVNISFAQQPQSQNQGAAAPNPPAKKDTIKQPAGLWFTHFVNYLNLPTWSIGASFGSELFYGDIKQFDWFPMGKNYIKKHLVPDENKLVPDTDKVTNLSSKATERKVGGGIYLAKQWGNLLSLRGSFMFGELGGVSYKTYNSQEWQQNGSMTVYPYHSVYFLAPFHEFAVDINIYLNKIMFPNQAVGRFSVYAIGGIGLMTFKSSLYSLQNGDLLNGSNDLAATVLPADQNKNVTENNKTTETTFDVGLGARYHLNQRFFVFAETTLRNVNTDKLDSWDNVLTAKDKYQYTCIGLTFSFGNLNDSLLDNKLKNIYDLNKVAHKNKSALEKRVDSLQNLIGDLGHRVGNLENNQTIINDSLKIIENHILGLLGQKGNNTSTINNNVFTASDAVAQLLVIFFDYNKYNIKPEYHERLALVAKILKSDPSITIQIVGHADKSGSVDYNLKLSKKRTEAVRNELIEAYGIDPSRLSNLEGKGKADPLSNKYDDVNRRVDFIFTKPIENKKDK